MSSTNITTICKYAIAALVIVGMIVLMALRVMPVATGVPIITLAAGYKAGSVVTAKRIASKK